MPPPPSHSGIGPEFEPEPVPVERAAFDPGTAGASARREGQRRRDKREARIRAAHPRLGGVILALTDDPSSTRVWATGAVGERIVGEFLAQLSSQGVVSLHDRRIPRSRANIDHIAVAPSGVYVIDAKRYQGKAVTTRVTGPIWNRGRPKLIVGGRDKSGLLDGVLRQAEAVKGMLRAASTAGSVPSVVPMLCFVEGDFGWFAKPMTIDGVWIGFRKSMGKVLTQPGNLSAAEIDEIGRLLAERLPPA